MLRNGGYFFRILEQPAKRNEFIAVSQSHVGGGIARYDVPIWLYPTNDEGKRVYDPITMAGCGYDTHEE